MTRLREARLQRGLTQLRLAALTGIAPSDISSVETGRRRTLDRDASITEIEFTYSLTRRRPTHSANPQRLPAE